MLSSGTLNLKFMQRKANPNIKPKLEEPPSTKEAQVLRAQGAVTITQSSSAAASTSSTTTRQRRDPSTLSIVFEESLISFPWLSWRRPTAPSPSGPPNDGLLPAHIGRKSYGEFNKAIQKLDDGPAASSSSAPHKRPQPESPSRQSSRPEKPKKLKNDEASERGRGPRHGGEQRHDGDEEDADADQKTLKKKKKKNTATTSTMTQQEGRAGEGDASAGGFKKPFSATAIKTKRKQGVTGEEPGLSKPHSATKAVPKPARPQAHQQQRRQEHAQESIVISSDDAPPHPPSDDNEAVHRQIDLMFAEARNAHLA